MLLSSAFILSLLYATSNARSSLGLIVTTNSGPVVGHFAQDSNEEVREFLGIPFATPPANDLRWEPPRKASPWKEPLTAADFGPSCYNIAPVGGFLGSDSSAPVTLPVPSVEDEDCLSVNIWAPNVERKEAKNAAVMIWVHGGAFTRGGSFAFFYNGRKIVQSHDGVIVVSFNYRLNVFGFPNNPELKDGEGNLGLLDIKLAIEWVRDNIEAFGGDPAKITLFGESAGGEAIDSYLYANPSNPIIRGAIIQSGATAVPPQHIPGNSNRENWNYLTTLLNCSSPSLHCMRSIPADTLRSTVANNNLTFSIAIDNVTVFHNIFSLLQFKEFAKIPILVGSNNEEVPGGTEQGNMITLSEFTCPASITARYRAAAGVPTWLYRYFGDFPILDMQRLGSFHGSEIPQVFGIYNETIFNGIASAEQIASSAYIQNAWVAFAKNPTSGLTRLGWVWNPSSPIDGEVPTYDLHTSSLVRLAYDNIPGATFELPSVRSGACPLVGFPL